MLQKLQASQLTKKHAQKLHIQAMTEQEASKAQIAPPWAGFKIPYFSPSGKLLEFYRYRFWPESKPSKGWASVTEASDLRYVQPLDTAPHIYLPPLLSMSWKDILSNPEQPMCITEGELKAACGCANGFTTLGLGGVFSWMSKRLHQDFLPILEQSVWQGRLVYLVFDADLAINPMVRLALSRLTMKLLSHGAIIHNVELPQGKLGKMDDYIVGKGAEAFQQLVDAAKPAKESKELHQLNHEVAVVWGGGGAGNIARVEDRKVISAMQFIRVLYRDRVYPEFTLNAKGEPGTPRLKYAAEEWLAWPHRQKVKGVTYAPGQPVFTDKGEFNTYLPPTLVAKKGDISPWLDLVSKVMAGLKPEAVLWFKRWLAYPLRHPGTKLFSCVLIWSYKGGTGKNLLAECMKPIYGEDNYTLIKGKQLLSKFNGWAAGRQFVIGDEIALDDKRHTSGDLKSMLTNRTIWINKKGIEEYELPDCTNYYLTSNDPIALFLDPGERRTFVHQAPETSIGNDYGIKFMQWLNKDGAAAIAWHLLHELDMGDFAPTGEPPDTDARLELIANSRSEIDTWAAALKLNPKRYLGESAHKYAGSNGSAAGPFVVYTPEDLLKIYDPEDKKRVGLRALGIALGRAGFKRATDNNGRLNNTRSTFWIIGSDREMTGTQAAKLYQDERPERFKPPSQREKEKRVQ